MRDKAFNIAKNPRRNPKSMMDINVEFLQWFTIFLINKSASREDISSSGRGAKVKLFQTKNYLKNYTNQLSENLKKKSILIC